MEFLRVSDFILVRLKVIRFPFFKNTHSFRFTPPLCTERESEGEVLVNFVLCSLAGCFKLTVDSFHRLFRGCFCKITVPEILHITPGCFQF